MESERIGIVRRWTPCVAMLLLSLLSYVDRSVLAILSPTILGTLHMTVTQYGYALSAFSVCYMLANPVWGVWIDRGGVWLMTLVAVGMWSVASGSHALMGGVIGMCVARGALGFGEGATFPAGLATVTETLPVEQRSFGLGLAYSGGSLGAMLTPLLITPIALRYGWRVTFLVTGGLGLVWMLGWVGLRMAGVYGASGRAWSVVTSTAGRWNRELIATGVLYGLGAAPLAFGLYAAPLYLSRVLHVGQASLGHWLWVPPAGWEVGYLVWGRVADYRRSRRQGRPVGLIAVLCGCGFVVVLLPLAGGLAATMVVFFLQMFVAGGFVVLSLADGVEAQPKENAAFLGGFAVSCWAAVTAVLAPVLGSLFDHGLYGWSLWVVALLPVLGGVGWYLIHSGEWSKGGIVGQ